MGSVILMAGDKRNMTAGSRIMIHEASTIAMGDARSLRKTSDLLEGISAEIAATYAERTGGDVKAIRNLMYAETWMTADQAKENGFVDTIIKDGKAKAEFDTEPKSMSIFAKLFPGNEDALKIEASLLENDTLRADLESAQARITELTGLAEVNATLQTELSEVQAKLATFEADATAAAEKITELTAAAEVTEEKISARASELLAASGHNAPVPLAGENQPQGANAITRAAFNALDHIARNSFVAGGGKITD
jgi:hypothetical protein